MIGKGLVRSVKGFLGLPSETTVMETQGITYPASERGALPSHAARSQAVDLALPTIPNVGASQVATDIDTVIVLDVSPSMKETDYPPNRLGAAQEAVIEFVRSRVLSGVNGRIGLVSFSSGATKVCGLTAITQVDLLVTAVRSLTYGSGTNITSGLEAAEHILSSNRANAEAEILLLSDGGQNTGPRPESVADRIKAARCTIRTVGIGGRPSAVDESLLKYIASKDAYGRPLYRFIADTDGLARYFGELGGLTL